MCDIYDKLRSIGVSVDTADALSRVLETMPARSQEAFILWASGMEQKDAAFYAGVPLRTFQRTLRRVKVAVTCL